MRSAPLVAAAEAVRARLDAQIRPDNPHNKITNRSLVSAVLQRADEPGEMIAYWLSRHGRRIPISVKRGITDAIIRLYTERALLKYDTAEHPVRFGDVVDLVQPATHVPAIRGTWRYDLYGHAIDRRHGRDRAIPEPLTTLHSRAALMAVPVEQRRDLLGQPGTADMLRTAGVTWEALAGWLQGPLDATARSAVIPSMGLFGLVRNLRNLDEAGVPDQVAETVAARLADPVLIARSRMFPFRFWAVYKNTASLRWAQALEQALVASLANVPTLPGRTLVLVDRSPSMFPGHGFSAPNRSDISLAERAAVFGAAVALRAEQATLVEYGFTSRPVSFRRG
ncbi:MAG TPA: TROVE domain-containing protein [Mycobacteriales bacterium]